MDADAAAQLTRLGGAPLGFSSRELKAPMIEQADLVLTATRQHRADVLLMVPRALRRSFTLLEFAQLVDQRGYRSAYGEPARLVASAVAARGSTTWATLTSRTRTKGGSTHSEGLDGLDRRCGGE